jgi:hypothetical protein
MKSYRSDLSLNEMDALAYDFADHVAGRAMFLPGDTTELHGDILQRVQDYEAFKTAAGAEAYRPGLIDSAWVALNGTQRAVARSGAVLLRSGDVLRQAQANLQVYQQQATSRKEKSVRMLMDTMWQHVGEPSLEVIDAVKPAAAVDVMEQLGTTFQRWRSRRTLDELRSAARQAETAVVAIAPEISERMTMTAARVAQIAPEQRQGLIRLLRKSGRQI